MGTSNKGITQHPLFPAVMTLWWGAFFGLSSLVIGQDMLESWVVAAGLPNYVASAQPPLGATARVLLALAACGLGAMLGLVLSGLLIRSERNTAMAIVPPLPDDREDATVREEPEAVAEEQPEPEIIAEDAEPVTVAEEYEERVPLATIVDDPLARFLRADDDHAPRAPFSVFDELGRDGAIASEAEEEREDLAQETPILDEAGSSADPVLLAASDPSADDEPQVEHAEEEEFSAANEAAPEPEPAPEFAGSPPLPSNVHPISAGRMAEHALPTRFARSLPAEPVSEPAPEPQPAPEAASVAAEEATAPRTPSTTEPLRELSYLQLTERLAQAIASNPRPPAHVRRSAIPRPANEPRDAAAAAAPVDPSDIRNALSGLRNFGGAA